jgi:ribosomal-protein-alanine N-acetyltransferase
VPSDETAPAQTPSRVAVQRVRRADAVELIAANRENAAYHAPWISAFTDQAGFDTWFARLITGPHISFTCSSTEPGATTSAGRSLTTATG